MPFKPKRPCSYPGCPQLTDGRYCEEHKKLTDRQYNLYQRDKVSQRFYQSDEWRQVNGSILRKNLFVGNARKTGNLCEPRWWTTLYR